VVDAKSKAAPIAPTMLDKGIELTVTNTVQLAVATQGFIDACMAGDITHIGQPLLGDAIASAALRELPRGDSVWDEAASGKESAALKAITLAHWAVLNFAEEPQPAAAPSTGEGAPVDLDMVGGDIMSAGF
jgi:hypothetical protein